MGGPPGSCTLYPRARAFRREARALGARDPAAVLFDQVGEAHLEAGRLREAATEFRRLAALHPTEAEHHLQMVGVLLEAGLGEAAREEARRAVELEPANGCARGRAGALRGGRAGARPAHPGRGAGAREGRDGRIAEHLGEVERARRYYGRVEPPASGREVATSAHALARRRLAALGPAAGEGR